MSAAQMADLFPFHLVFDRHMRVCQTGSSLRKILPALQPGADLTEYLKLERPASAFRFSEILEHAGSLFLLTVRERKLRLRGQMVPLPGNETIAFLCSPWLPEPGEFRSTGLTFDDFPLHDSMPEFMNVVQSQRLSMDDLHKLSQKLRQQRETLKEVNRQLLEQSTEAQKLALIAARTDNGVVITDAQGRVEWVNRAFERTTGYALEELRGRTPGSFLQGPDTDPETVDYIRRQLRSGLGFTCEIVNYSKSGARYWVAIEVQPIRDKAGKVTNFMAIENDITSRREAEFRKNLAYAVTTILAESTETSEALHKLLHTIVEAIGYQFGVVWRLHQTSRKLRPVRIWSRPDIRNSWFEVDTRGRTFERGIGLPGMVWERNEPFWIPDLSAEPNFLRHESARRDGLRSGFASPIRVGGEARGAIEFFSSGSELPDPELLRTLSSMGNQIGQFMERQDAEAERRRLFSLLRSTLESTAEGIVVVDLQQRFVTWNQRFLEIWGMTPAVMDQERDVALRHAASLLHQPEEFARRLQWWYDHPGDSGEDVVQFADGRIFRRTTQPQIADGAVIGRIWSYRDVTESWLAEKALRASEERYRVITATASDGIITVNTSNVILFANEAAERIFDYPAGTLVQLPFSEIMGDDYRRMGTKGLMRTVHQSEAPGGSRPVKIVGRRRDGAQIPLEVSFGRSRIRGQQVFTGVIRDITARNQAEEQIREAMRKTEAANRAKSDFLASISHEIRTPLNSITGLSELLRETPLNDDQREMVNTIWTGSESLLNLINDLLDFSKMEAGQVEVVTEEFDPQLVCERAAEIANSRAQKKGLALTCTVNSPPPRLLGDAGRISQILLNLVVNAVKFTETGYVAMEMSWRSDGPGRAAVEFRVRDTGIGVAPEDRERIFEKFYRIDTQLGRRAGGTGLGLSIARLLAKRMGGTLTFQPEPNGGSCFCLSLNLPVANLPATTPARLATPATRRTAVLLSRPADIEMLTAAWTSAGVEVVAFHDATAACAFLDADHPCEFVLLAPAASFDALELRRFFRLLALRGRSRCIQIRPPDGRSETPPLATGCVVTIDFPLTPGRMSTALKRVLDPAEDPWVAGEPVQHEPEELTPDSPARILLVEDNPDNQAYAARVLRKAGHDLTIAASVTETLQLVHAGQYDLIFMDVMLPDGSGFDAAVRIREFERAAGRERSPVVALTANAMQEYRERALAAGMDDYLTKPVRPEALLSAVRKWTPQQLTKTPGGGPVEIDPDLADLIPDFLVRVRKSVAEIEGLALVEDLVSIGRIGHNLKGSGAAYGFPEITRLGKEIEFAGRDGNAVAAREAARALTSYLEGVRWESASEQ